MSIEIIDLRVKGPLSFIEIAEVENGVPNRRILTPDTDVSAEDPQIQALANEHWTDDIKAGYEEQKQRELAWHLEQKAIEDAQLQAEEAEKARVTTLENTITALEQRLAALEG